MSVFQVLRIRNGQKIKQLTAKNKPSEEIYEIFNFRKFWPTNKLKVLSQQEDSKTLTDKSSSKQQPRHIWSTSLALLMPNKTDININVWHR